MEIHLFLILAFLAVIQSLVGVGVLLFGTPILLLLNYSFVEVLIVLTPISLVISVATLTKKWSVKKLDWSLLILPVMVFTGTYLATGILEGAVTFLVSLLLIGLGIQQIKKTEALNYAEDLPAYKKNLVIQIIAFIHGLSNQGGGLLVWASKYIHSEKYARRGIIAFIYGLFALIQILSILYLHPVKFIESVNVYLIATGIIAYFIGETIFRKIGQKHYDLGINISMIIFGSFLAIKLIAVKFGFQL